MDDKLVVEKVCPQWETSVRRLWKKQLRFDIRDLRYTDSAEKCLKRCGETLETIYYYKDYEVSPISRYCSNTKALTIDFQDRMYSGDKRRGKPDIPDLQPTLLELKNLTSLTLKNVDRLYNYDFLKDLPETMTELHIFSESEYTEAHIKLAKFSNLRALTLNNFEYGKNENCIFISGIEKLENLKYLRLEAMHMVGFFGNPFENLTKLEYLSLRGSEISVHYITASILRSNKNLRYLDLSGFKMLRKSAFRAIPKLKYLKTLCLANLDYDDDDDDDDDDDSNSDNDNNDDDDDDDEFPDQPLWGMPNLEYFNYDSSTILRSSVLKSVISSSPNLKLLVVLSDKYDAQQIVDAADRATFYNTDDEQFMKVILGDRAESVDDTDAASVLACNQLDEDGCLVFQIDFNEWYLVNYNK